MFVYKPQIWIQIKLKYNVIIHRPKVPKVGPKYQWYSKKTSKYPFPLQKNSKTILLTITAEKFRRF